MARSCFSRAFLLYVLLLIFSNNVNGRKMVDLSVYEEHVIAAAAYEQGKSREMMGLDYADAGPNFNGRSAFPLPTGSLTPPPPPPPPPPSPPQFGY